MATEFKLPEVAEGVESADIAQIMVSEGDVIEAGQTVMEIETEKATVELPCPHAGEITKVHVSQGDTVEVGALLLTIEEREPAGPEQERREPEQSQAEEREPAAGERERPREKEPAEEEPTAKEEKEEPARREIRKEPARAEAGEFDVELIVLGGGPGGYPAAFEAADRGMEVTLVDDGIEPGGVCLHRGCIPSKALLHVARVINESREAAEWGIRFGEPQIDLDKLREFKSRVVGRLTGGVAELCRSRGVRHLKARGTFIDAHTLEVKSNGQVERISARHIILATGSSPVMPKVFDIGDARVMDSTTALDLPDVPRRLLVVGGGYIGLEMGTVYAALGSRVTVVEMLDGLLPGVDRDLVRPLARRLQESFEAIHLKTKVAGLKAADGGIVAELEGKDVESPQEFDRVLVAVGRRPNSDGIGLEKTQVEIDEKGFVRVDSRRRTAEASILAIGDVAGEPMLAHKATREAKVAVEVLADEPAEFDNVAIPAVVFTDPEVAWCGLTETEAKSEGREVKVARFSWAASGRARTIDRTEGLTKLIYDPSSERILGMGVVGPGAGELIAEGVLAVEMAAVARDVAESIHAHPTLSETVMESAESVFGQATHVFKRR